MKVKKKTKLFEWQMRCKSGTEKCKCGETRHLTVDHIVPAFLLEQFGLDRVEILYEMEENFEILCRYCNQMKSSRIDVRNPKTYEIMTKILENARKYYLPQLFD
jgi:5-methylcytosine-specific restriction endonuclease McrA